MRPVVLPPPRKRYFQTREPALNARFKESLALAAPRPASPVRLDPAKEGSQVFNRRPRRGRNPVRICPFGIAGCCGLVTLGQPKFAQGSVTALCARGATAIPVPAQYGEP